MRPAHLLLAILVLSLLGAAPVRADDPRDRTLIRAAMDRELKAFEAGDANGVASVWAPSYVDVDVLGARRGRGPVFAGLRSLMSAATALKPSYTLDSFSLIGDRAVALVSQRATANLRDPAGGAHPASWRTVQAEDWVRTASGWQVALSATVYERILVDGKSFVPQSRPADAPVRDALQASYDEYARGVVGGALDQIQNSLPPDFRAIGTDGVPLDREAFTASEEKRFATIPREFTVTIGRLTVDGDRATVARTFRYTAVSVDAAGASHTAKTMVSGRDTWKRSGTHWIPVEARTLYRETSADGKPQPPAFAAPKFP